MTNDAVDEPRPHCGDEVFRGFLLTAEEFWQLPRIWSTCWWDMMFEVFRPCSTRRASSIAAEPRSY